MKDCDSCIHADVCGQKEWNTRNLCGFYEKK